MIKLSLRKLRRDLTVGEILAKQRNELDLTLEEVAAYIKVSRQYLESLEAGDYKNLPAQVYINNFIKSYAGFVGLDGDVLIKRFANELDLYKKIHKKEEDTPIAAKRSDKIKFHHFLIVPKLIKSVIIIVIVGLFLTYLGFELKKIASPPELFVMYPPNNFITEDPYIEVSGEADKEAKILINGQEILSDRIGSFKTTVNLNRGVNIITVNAINKHGNETVIYRKIMLEENENVGKK